MGGCQWVSVGECEYVGGCQWVSVSNDQIRQRCLLCCVSRQLCSDAQEGLLCSGGGL